MENPPRKEAGSDSGTTSRTWKWFRSSKKSDRSTDPGSSGVGTNSEGLTSHGANNEAASNPEHGSPDDGRAGASPSHPPLERLSSKRTPLLPVPSERSHELQQLKGVKKQNEPSWLDGLKSLGRKLQPVGGGVQQQLSHSEAENSIPTAARSINTEIGPAIGIDLGTTYSCVAVRQKGGVQIIPNDLGGRITPSCVAFTMHDRLFGDAAKNQEASNPINTIFDAKRLIGRTFHEETVQQEMKLWPFKVLAGTDDKPMIAVTYKDEQISFTPEQISSMVLEKMKNVAETYLGCKVTNAVITVPAYFNNSQRQATENAGVIAGLNVLQIIHEPTAAALAYGLSERDNHQRHNMKPKNILVFDFGGGTLDVCVLVIQSGVIEVKAIKGNTHLGGQDITNNMVQHFAREFERKHKVNIKNSVRAIARLRAACERGKVSLSTATCVHIEVDALYEGKDFSASITRAKFENLNAELFESCMEPIELCLQDAGLSKGDVHDILLVGGSTRIPKVQSMLKEFFDEKALCNSIHVDEAVAYGAAIWAAVLGGWDGPHNEDLVLIDATPISLGLKVAGEMVVPVINRNTRIPCKEEKQFPTSIDCQRGITFEVYEGERSMAADNNLLGKFVLDGLESRPAGEVIIFVTFEINVNGILEVSARDYTTGRTTKVTISNDRGRLTWEQIEAMIKDAAKYRLQDENRKNIALARLELDGYLYKLKQDLSKEEVMSKLDEAEAKNLRKTIDDALHWSEENEYKAEVHEFRSKKASIEKIWRATLAQ